MLMVADGFSADQMPGFTEMVEEVRKLLDPQTFDLSLTQPFASYRSAIRLWKVEKSAQAADGGGQVMKFYEQAGSVRTTLRNLAVLSRVSLKFAGKSDILAFIGPPAEARASTHGTVVLQPRNPDAPTAANVFVHELGHTILGNLGDEYVKKDEKYLGPDPGHPNLARLASGSIDSGQNPLPGSLKWNKWGSPSLVQDWDDPVSAFEGGYEYARGILARNPRPYGS